MKVNYLYQDCSQTLTKINRAFHPIQADLPQDANLAPFHSINLCEISKFEFMELDDVGFPSTRWVNFHILQWYVWEVGILCIILLHIFIDSHIFLLVVVVQILMLALVTKSHYMNGIEILHLEFDLGLMVRY